MSGKNAKKIRKEIQHIQKQMSVQLIKETKHFFNMLPLKERIRIAWRIVRRRF